MRRRSTLMNTTQATTVMNTNQATIPSTSGGRRGRGSTAATSTMTASTTLDTTLDTASTTLDTASTTLDTATASTTLNMELGRTMGSSTSRTSTTRATRSTPSRSGTRRLHGSIASMPSLTTTLVLAK